MKNLITSKKLQCALDNPLFPTLVTLHLPEMKLENENVESGKGYTFKAQEQINIELKKMDKTTMSSFDQEKLEVSLKTANGRESLNLEVEDQEHGVQFTVGFDNFGDVKSVSARWSKAS